MEFGEKKKKKKQPPNRDTTKKMITLTKLSADMAKRMQITEYYRHKLRKTEWIWRNGQKGMLIKGEIEGIKKQQGKNRTVEKDLRREKRRRRSE